MTGRLAGRVAVVTGGASGIGAAICRRFVAEGARVGVIDQADADPIVKELGEQSVGVSADVTDEDSFRRAIGDVAAHFGGLDVMVNNAGIDGDLSRLADYSTEAFDRVVAVNLRGVFLGMKYAIPHMNASASASIVNIASVAGIRGVRCMSAYCATKAAVIGMTRAAALDHTPDGIRVNTVVPGVIETPLLQVVFDKDPSMREPLLANQPVAHFGRPDDIAAAVAFLASDDSRYVTGTEIVVDGGMATG